MKAVRAASTKPAAGLASMRGSRLGVCTVPGQSQLQQMPRVT